MNTPSLSPPRIDLRSDTFTLPSPGMREAMCLAPLGDDVFGEDPTVNELEALAADRLGKEAAVLVSSGTQGNLVSLLSHCGRGDEAIMGDQAHTFHYEQGGSAALGGIHPHLIPTLPNGALPLAEIERAIRAEDAHFPVTRLVLLENTHNRAGGVYLTPEYTDDVAALAHDSGLKLHIDGARIFNAAVAQDIDVEALVRHADSVTFCLSKGLAAPVGSVVCGSADFIRQARRARKVLGGGMRQAGVIAAAGIIALNEMVERLAIDHENARRLAKSIADLPGISLDLDLVQTNIFYFDLDHPLLTTPQFVQALRNQDIGVLDIGTGRIRVVTHYGIESEHIDETIASFEAILSK